MSRSAPWTRAAPARSDTWSALKSLDNSADERKIGESTAATACAPEGKSADSTLAVSGDSSATAVGMITDMDSHQIAGAVVTKSVNKMERKLGSPAAVNTTRGSATQLRNSRLGCAAIDSTVQDIEGSLRSCVMCRSSREA